MSLTSGVSQQLLKQLISIFPSPVSFAFAYGSGVFHQDIMKPKGITNTKMQRDAHKHDSDTKSVSNMIDLILVVDESVSWHHKNLSMNGSHYNLIMRQMGSKWISWIQENFDAKVYFNTLVPIDNLMIKYGIISNKHLINDLLDWDTLYISGRLHKPVYVVVEPVNNELLKALKINYQNAIHASLLTLPEVFSEEDLYLTIAGLSYSGDFRMIVGEDKNKVKKIVSPQMDRFRSIYQPLLTSQSMNDVIEWNPNTKTYTQNCSPLIISHHLNLLPKNIQQHLYVAWNVNVNGRLRDLDDVLNSLAQSYDCQAYVRKAIKDVVWKSSWSQSFKGIFTAGLLKSMRYGGKKLFKMFKSLKN